MNSAITRTELKEITPDFKQVVMPVGMTKTFNTKAPDPGKAVHTSTVERENKTSFAAAKDGIKEADQSIKVLDDVIKQNGADAANESGPSLMGSVASVGISLATGGVMTPLVAATAGPVGAALFCGAGSLATFKDVANIAKSLTKESGEKNSKTESSYEAAPSQNSFDYVAQQNTGPAPVGTKADIKAFKNAAGRLGPEGGGDLFAKSNISEESLKGVEVLKISIENQREISKQSLQDAGQVRGVLEQRYEKSVDADQGVNGITSLDNESGLKELAAPGGSSAFG